TASATAGQATSEFNVIGGTTTGPVLDALLARTGPLSDEGSEANLDTLLRRWKRGTTLVFELSEPPSVAVERYLRFLVQHVGTWTGGHLNAEVRFAGAAPRAIENAVV